ncbi:MAG: FAD-dependent monooxygenase [Bacteroidetes bacterium]|nr:FAD-dependent monooxygenase [Bacteroidota bacterium]
MITTDAVVVGAGPAGCSYALNLAPNYRVLVIDRMPERMPKAGESLPPAANKLIKDMGLWDDFIRQGHLPHYGNQSRWGSDELKETDFLRDPDGHGWHINRQQFERWMQQKAKERGAECWSGVKLEEAVQLPSKNWRITVSKNNETLEIDTRLLIDAGGRQSSVARRLGANRIQTDSLICGWVIGKDDIVNPQGLSYIQSEENGWWYTAPLTAGKRIISFHTDNEQNDNTWLRSPQDFWQRLQQQTQLSRHISLTHFCTNPLELIHGTTAANSSYLQPCAGEGWLATGDAALGFDPLSSQGIFNALYTGLAAAENSYRYLSGACTDFNDYIHSIQSIKQAYQRHLEQWYGEEKRWADAPFWRKRLGE